MTGAWRLCYSPRGEATLYTYHQKRMIAGYVFISPWVIGFLVFVVGSLLASLFLSFTNFENYAKLFFDDPWRRSTISTAW